MTGAVLDVDEVRHALTARRVLDYYQLPTRRSGRHEREATAYPRRADHTRRAFTINLQTGQWRRWPCDIGGDPLRLVAEFEHLSDRDDFSTVLARAAEIAGVVASDLPDAERARRAEQWRRERLARAAATRTARAELERTAVRRATRYWDGLPRNDDRGMAYLAERGLAAAAPLIRFDAGSPAVPLFTRTGEIRNVVRRRLPELGEPKVSGLKGCPTAGTLLGTLTAIAADRPAVVVEGVDDALTQRSPGRTPSCSAPTAPATCPRWFASPTHDQQTIASRHRTSAVIRFRTPPGGFAARQPLDLGRLRPRIGPTRVLARERALEQRLGARALWRAAMRGACIALISVRGNHENIISHHPGSGAYRAARRHLRRSSRRQDAACSDVTRQGVARQDVARRSQAECDHWPAAQGGEGDGAARDQGQEHRIDHQVD